MLVGLVGQTRTGSLGPQELGVFLEVLVHERPVGQVLEVAATEGVCRGDDFVTHREQDVTRRHLGEAGLGAEVGSLDLLVPLQRSRAVNLDAEAFEDLDVVVELLVSCFNGCGRTGSPHAAHLGVNRNLFGGCGLFGRNYGEVCTANDNVLQRIEIIPGIDDLRHCVHSLVSVLLIYPQISLRDGGENRSRNSCQPRLAISKWAGFPALLRFPEEAWFPWALWPLGPLPPREVCGA